MKTTSDAPAGLRRRRRGEADLEADVVDADDDDEPGVEDDADDDDE